MSHAPPDKSTGEATCKEWVKRPPFEQLPDHVKQEWAQLEQQIAESVGFQRRPYGSGPIGEPTVDELPNGVH